MASSEVEIVSSSPFGCVLKDRNRRDQCRDSNAKAAAFQKNLKELVRDHFQNCISVSVDENSESVDSDSGIGKEQGKHNRNLRFLNNNHNKVNANKRFTDDYSILSSTQSRSLDRWAARQAREIVSNIEKQNQEAECLASSSSSSSSSSSPSSSKRENQLNSPAESMGSPEIGNLGASSLVQIWEARLNRSNSMNNNLNPPSTSSRTSSGMSNNENIEEHPRESEMGGDYVDERYETQANHEDSFPDWEAQSDRTAQSEPPTSSQGRNSENGDSERVRISDIIKKLASASDDSDREPGVNVCESPSRERRNSPETDHVEQREQREHRSLAQVISSPKIRGRQAFADLLMQLERDRHKELNSLVERQAVSKFSHRGRIQSMLRIRFLQRGMVIQDQKHPQSAGSPVKLSQGSTIMHLREKFSTGIDHGVTSQSDASTSRSPHTEMANNTVHLQNSSTANRLGEDGRNLEATNAERKSTAPTENSVPQTIKDHQKESSPRTDVTQQGMNRETTFLDPQGTSEVTTFLNDLGTRNGIAQDQEANHRQHIYSNSQGNSESTASSNGWNEHEMAEQQDADDQQQLYLDSHETAETSASLNNWEENEQDDEEEETYEQEHYVETNYDWISEISRPRNYWEDRRQTWYQEMLSSSSENEEIRQLLERRRVSTFLASDFRGTMDQLITSRVQRQTELGNYQEEEQKELGQETIRQFLLSHVQRHMHSTVSQEEQAEEGNQAEQVVEEEQEQEDDEEDEEQEEEEDEEEGQSPISDQFQESSDYFDQSSPSVQTASPSMIRTWSYRDHEVTDDSDPVVSTSSPPPLPSQAYYQDSRQSSFSTNHISIETELIYDLRGQIEQLHREMSELRKSIQSCVDMQVKMQPSNQPEVHRVRGMGNNSLDGAPKKRSCCICYEMQVDSLLYRCGHMCTCLKCAHELQWSSGKCPICRAPIMDVVRACMDSWSSGERVLALEDRLHC